MTLKYFIRNRIKPIEIKLHQSKFVDKWISYMLNISQHLPHLKWSGRINHTNIGWNDASTDLLLSSLLSSFEYINKYVDQTQHISRIKYLRNNVELLNQQDLNTFHRVFTNFAAYYYNEKISDKLLYTNFHNINKTVHQLEGKVIKTLKKRMALENPAFFFNIYTTDTKNLSNNKDLWYGDLLEEIYEEFCILEDDYNFDVWINDDIQGKDMVKGWLDEDDLTADDVWGNNFMTPNILLDPYYVIKRVLSNKDFIDEYKKVGKKLNRFPIGNLSDKEYTVSLLSKENVIFNKVILRDRLLWQL